MKELRLVLPSAPRTKKTSNRIFFLGQRCSACSRGSRAKVMPSEAWETWCNRLTPQIKAALPAGWKPIDFAVNCAALFYQDVDRADACGLYQGLADLLQHAGVVANDRWIRTWDGSLPLKDAQNPRVELVLTRKDVAP